MVDGELDMTPDSWWRLSADEQAEFIEWLREAFPRMLVTRIILLAEGRVAADGVPQRCGQVPRRLRATYSTQPEGSAGRCETEHRRPLVWRRYTSLQPPAFVIRMCMEGLAPSVD